MSELSPEQRSEALARILSRPDVLAEGMGIRRITPEGIRDGRLGPLFASQALLRDKVQNHRQTLVLKARRQGITTWTLSYLAARAVLARPPMAGRIIQSVAHHDDAVKTMAQITRHALGGLPELVRPRVKPNNMRITGLPNGSKMLRATAGGGSGGRSAGFTDFHATEMAFWPTGSAANGNTDTASDTDTWQSILSAMDDPTGKIIVESTGNGPRGLFYHLYGLAKDSKEWGFLFFPWTLDPRYQTPFPSDQEKYAFEASLDSDEKQLIKRFGVTLEQLNWRRYKFEHEMYDAVRFRREYPISDMEPFLLENSGWFDQEALHECLGAALGERNNSEPWQIFIPPEPGRTYFLGVDTSGGVGRDDAVIQILRDDLMHVATWRSNRTPPLEQARRAAQLSQLYNRGMILVESNKYGKTVIEHLQDLGANLWMNSQGKPFYSQGSRGGDSKRKAYSYTRELVDSGWLPINHPATIDQLREIVEKPAGQIEAAQGHDDLADGIVMAAWCGRGRFVRRGTDEERKTRFARLMKARRTLLRSAA